MQVLIHSCVNLHNILFFGTSIILGHGRLGGRASFFGTPNPIKRGSLSNSVGEVVSNFLVK